MTRDAGAEPFDYTFTVFTHTHNRAHALPRVYNSLRQQTFKDFKWLTIDNESTDGTEDVVRQWQRSSGFPIQYIWQANRPAPAGELYSQRQLVFLEEVAPDRAKVVF